MPIPIDYKDICEMLLVATSEGRVNWTSEGATLRVHLPEYNFEIWSGTDEDSGKEFIAVGLRKPGERRLIDNWYLEEGDEDFNMLESLFQEARSQGRGVREKLDMLRKRLESGSKIGLDEEKK